MIAPYQSSETVSPKTQVNIYCKPKSAMKHTVPVASHRCISQYDDNYGGYSLNENVPGSAVHITLCSRAGTYTTLFVIQ